MRGSQVHADWKEPLKSQSDTWAVPGQAPGQREVGSGKLEYKTNS